MSNQLEIVEFRQPDHEKTRNFGYRSSGVLIDTIVIHYTVSQFSSAYKTLTAPRGVSAHYLIDTDGATFNLVSDDKIAWHAGDSSWLNKDNVNDFSIGIELINSGSGQNTANSKLQWDAPDPFSIEQMTALHQLIGELKSRHINIKDRNIIGHSDITAYNARKLDPGIFFDWKLLAQQGHGLYPKCDTSTITPQILYSYNDRGPRIANLQNTLNQYGYKIKCTEVFDETTRNVVRAFNMHFHNDIHYSEFEYECWDNIAEMRLNDLLEQIKSTAEVV